jgi:NAD(P)-dependent dehydrogenase (short-subunit alcohol dehydrogenase family)
VVAASSKGLGKASALALAGEGARVTICARSEQELAAAAEEIRAETGADVLAVSADLRTPEGIQRVVAATVERFGGVDVLVNNSGGPAPGKFPSLTDDDWRHGFEVVTLNFDDTTIQALSPQGSRWAAWVSRPRSGSWWRSWRLSGPATSPGPSTRSTAASSDPTSSAEATPGRLDGPTAPAPTRHLSRRKPMAAASIRTAGVFLVLVPTVAYGGSPCSASSPAAALDTWTARSARTCSGPATPTPAC